MKKYELRIDEAFCWGCRACEVACRQENHLPDGIRLIAATEEFSCKEDGTPNVVFRLKVCRHCDDPPCAAVCPVDAITQRKDGIVILDSAECTGCEACLEACPYGAIDFDAKNGVAGKCNLCYQRLDSGLLPACADNICLGHCIHLEDPHAVHKVLSGIRAAEP
jgi:Fe-S-cluster-containing dehydrogenase component